MVGEDQVTQVGKGLLTLLFGDQEGVWCVQPGRVCPLGLVCPSLGPQEGPAGVRASAGPLLLPVPRAATGRGQVAVGSGAARGGGA